MENNNNKSTAIDKVRYHFDEKSNEFNFSIVDIIDNLDLSTDPRNYWKVLKNRLKKGHNELVTECNQLKMKSNDGKYYLTDAANSSILLQIIELISPEKVTTFEEFFNEMESVKPIDIDDIMSGGEKISTAIFDEGEIQIDMYQKDNFIFVKAMLAGVEPEDIFISADCQTLTIKINRIGQNNSNFENYNLQELYWGKFQREVSLPFEVDIDRVETNFKYGLLSVRLSILDKTRTKIIKVK